MTLCSIYCKCSASRLLCCLVVGTVQSQYANSYTLSGCPNGFESYCGVFTRLPAHCNMGSSDRCPGGPYANGNTDPTLCDGAPVYQTGGPRGPVLLRGSVPHAGTVAGGTRWYVSENSALANCEYYSNSNYPHTELIPGRLGYAPTAPPYQFLIPPSFHITVATDGKR